jgi:hypothetical protein
VTFESIAPCLIGRCSRQLRKNCVGVNMVYSRTESVFIPKHYFTSKSLAALREAFSNVYPEKNVPNERTTQGLVTKFWSHRMCFATSAYWETKQPKLRPYRIQAVHQLQQRGTAARIQYCHWFRRFMHGGCSHTVVGWRFDGTPCTMRCSLPAVAVGTACLNARRIWNRTANVFTFDLKFGRIENSRLCTKFCNFYCRIGTHKTHWCYPTENNLKLRSVILLPSRNSRTVRLISLSFTVICWAVPYAYDRLKC